jgi:hypothetical protein
VGVGLALTLDAEVRAALAAFVGPGEVSHALRSTEPAFRAPEVAVSVNEPRDDEASQGNLYDRVRELKSHEREVMARQGSLAERVALERCFQGSVWEALLVNPQLTAAEVARIAKNPGLPAALVNVIAANSAWLSKPEILRALLTNARLSGSTLERVLRSLPKAELSTIATHAAYRAPVRQAAKKLLGG